MALRFDALQDLPLPAILHWEGYHFVVLFEWSPAHAVVGDPARGLQRLTREAFIACWTGYTLEIVPQASLIVGGEEAMGLWRRIAPAARPFLGLVAEALAASALLSVLGLAFPLFTQIIVDRVLVDQSLGLLNMLLVGMIALAVFQALIRAIRQCLLLHIATRFDAQLMSDFVRHLFAVPLAYFEARRVGDITSRWEETRRVREAISGTLPGVALDVGLALTYTALLLHYNARLALVVFAIIPFCTGLVLLFTPAFRRNEREQFERHTDASTCLIEAVTGIGTVKAMALECEMRWRLESRTVDALLASRRGALILTVYSALAGLVQSAGSVVLFWFGARQVLAGSLTTGQLLAFFTIAGNLLQPVLNLTRAWQTLQQLRNSVERLDDVFESKPEQPSDENLLHPGSVRGGVRLEKVTFIHAGNDMEPAVNEVSLEIQPGQTLADDDHHSPPALHGLSC